VAAVLILSAGLQRAGVIQVLSAQLARYTSSQTGHLLFLVGICTVSSAFMNNVGALALLMPVAIATAIERERSPALLLIPVAFGSLLGGMTTLIGWLPTPVSFVLACTAFVLTRIVPPDELYASVDWSVVVLLGAMFPLGIALEETGASRIVAEQVLWLASDWPVWAVLTLFLVITMVVSDVVNNAATALLMAPIALSTAERLGASPDAFLMAVAIGASCAFLTPVGHQSNILILGPGGYQFPITGAWACRWKS
jgi:di/tricarboxylate transporter